VSNEHLAELVFRRSPYAFEEVSGGGRRLFNITYEGAVIVTVSQYEVAHRFCGALNGAFAEGRNSAVTDPDLLRYIFEVAEKDAMDSPDKALFLRVPAKLRDSFMALLDLGLALAQNPEEWSAEDTAAFELVKRLVARHSALRQRGGK